MWPRDRRQSPPVSAATRWSSAWASSKQSLQRLAAAERGRPGTGADAHAILSDAVQIDQALLTQHLHGLFEQRLHELGVVGPEIGERVVVDGDAPGEPAKGIVTDAQIGEFAGAGEAREGGIQPQGDEQTRIDGRPSGNAAAGPDAVRQRGEVQPLDVGPDGAGGVVGLEELIDGHGREELLAIGDGEARWGGAVGLGAAGVRGVGHGRAERRAWAVAERRASSMGGGITTGLAWGASGVSSPAPSRIPWASPFIIRSRFFHRLSGRNFSGKRSARMPIPAPGSWNRLSTSSGASWPVTIRKTLPSPIDLTFSARTCSSVIRSMLSPR